MPGRVGFLILLWIFSSSIVFSQVVYEPLDNDVYNYLSRLSSKGVIVFNDNFKPLARKYILEKLNEAEGKINLLTPLEREELHFFKREFYIENKKFNDNESSGFFENDSIDRFRLFYYTGEYLKLNASPILRYKLEWQDNLRHGLLSNGFHTFGYLPANIGFDFSFRITNERGKSADPVKDFTPETGVVTVNNRYSFNYSDVNAMLSIDWDWGTAAIAKHFLEFGHAVSGKLILSDKAPSFPFIFLHINPADWIDFHWFHAWLSSTVIDSLQLQQYKRNIYHDKYFSWHNVTITPFKGFDISIGESIVYSDKIEIIYLMPFMFYYLSDEYISDIKDKPGDANTQFFIALSSKNHVPHTHLYSSMFIDELTVSGISGTIIPENPSAIFKHRRTQLGFTAGISSADLPITNLTTTFEYTKIYPFVYGHHTPAQTYTNSSYLMGHWMGHNGDLLHLQMNYRFLRGLQLTAWAQYIRKGSSDYSRQYKGPSPAFLFGLRTNYTYFGLDLKYEMIHELIIEASYRTNDISKEIEINLFQTENENHFSFSVYYGI